MGAERRFLAAVVAKRFPAWWSCRAKSAIPQCLAAREVPGYVETILVDRGSVVKEGQLLAQLSAPEIARRSPRSNRKCRLPSRIVCRRCTAGCDGGHLRKPEEGRGNSRSHRRNELVQMERQVEAARALVKSRRQAGSALMANKKTLQEMQSYLRITAPLDGVITDRFVHPGALVGPGAMRR